MSKRFRKVMYILLALFLILLLLCFCVPEEIANNCVGVLCFIDCCVYVILMGTINENPIMGKDEQFVNNFKNYNEVKKQIEEKLLLKKNSKYVKYTKETESNVEINFYYKLHRKDFYEIYYLIKIDNFDDKSLKLIVNELVDFINNKLEKRKELNIRIILCTIKTNKFTKKFLNNIFVDIAWNTLLPVCISFEENKIIIPNELFTTPGISTVSKYPVTRIGLNKLLKLNKKVKE